MRPAPVAAPVDLILVGHGSRDPAARTILGGLRDAVAARLPHASVLLAWIELDVPLLADVLPPKAALQRAVPPVVVPLLLSRGTHVTRDLPPGAAPPLGPDPVLTTILLDRISTAGIAAGRALVLAATGSNDPDAGADIEAQAALLERAWRAPVGVGFVTASPSIADACADLERTHGAPPAVVSYFLAPGRLPASARADTGYIGDHPLLVDLVLDRYGAALRRR